MSSTKDGSRSSIDRVRRREDEQPQGEAENGQTPHSATHAVFTSTASNPTEPSAAHEQQKQSNGVQPLAERMRKRPRRSPRLNSPLNLLADVELQLVMQWLNADGKLKAARCSRRLLKAASHFFAWKDVAPFALRARTAADVHSICLSLLQFAPIHLICIGMASLDSVAAVPHLRVLELNESPPAVAASLEQLLQHPCVARLQSLRLGAITSFIVHKANVMQLVARLPQLRALDLGMPCEHAASTALLQPLAETPTLTDLALRWPGVAIASTALLNAIARISGLRRLSLGDLCSWGVGAFSSFFCSPNIRQLQHLELRYFVASPTFSFQAPSAGDYQVAFSALQQLQSLTLQKVMGIHELLPHLRHASALRLLSVRCQPQSYMGGGCCPLLLSRPALAELLAAAPQLQVRLPLPSSLERWLAMGSSTDSWAQYVDQWQWHQLHGMAEDLDRVAIVYDESS